MDEGARRGVDRLTIQEAARRLGVSEGAVRKRVTRGTLEHEKEDDGRIYIYLDAGDRRGVDIGQDTGVDPNNDALISQLRDEVAYLRDENRRKDEIIMQQAMTMRQLTAAPSQGATEAAETVEQEPERGQSPTLLREGLAKLRAYTGPGGVGCWDGSVDEKSLQLLKVMREQLGETTASRTVDAVAAAKSLGMYPGTLERSLLYLVRAGYIEEYADRAMSTRNGMFLITLQGIAAIDNA